jgi:hypothetical protein
LSPFSLLKYFKQNFINIFPTGEGKFPSVECVSRLEKIKVDNRRAFITFSCLITPEKLHFQNYFYDPTFFFVREKICFFFSSSSQSINWHKKKKKKKEKNHFD